MCEGLSSLRMWQEFMVGSGCSADATVKQYRYAVLRLLAATPKDSLREITEQDVVAFLATLGKHATARQMYFRAFRSFFRWAHERGHVDVDPTLHFKPKPAPKDDADAFSPEEIVAIIEAARPHKGGDRRAAAISLAYSMGLRRSEVCGITPDDVDWSNKRVHIRESKGHKPRWVEANDIAMQALESLASTPHPHREHARPPDKTLVGVAPAVFTMWVHQAASAAGLPVGRRNAHLLRSSFATHLLGAGAPISVVSKLLGHSDVAVTSRYLAVTGPSRRDAVNLMRLVPDG